MFKIVSNHDEATGDNRTLFSEIQLSGDTNEPRSDTNTLDADFRLSRLRRSPIEDQRLSSASSRNVISDNKVFDSHRYLFPFLFEFSSRNFQV